MKVLNVFLFYVSQSCSVLVWLFIYTDQLPLYVYFQLNMKNAADARYVENHISFNDMRAFVCEDPNDLELFMSTMRDEQRLKVNVVKMPVEAVESFRPPQPLAAYR